jgi:hypothetical protein
MAAGDVKNFHECDVAFHRKIWELAGNDYLRDTLEAVTFRLFVFSVVDRWPGNSKAISDCGSPQYSSTWPFWKACEVATGILPVKYS